MEGGCIKTTTNSNGIFSCPEPLMHENRAGILSPELGQENIFLTWSQVQIKSFASIFMRGWSKQDKESVSLSD
jgi:hypothetical protein